MWCLAAIREKCTQQGIKHIMILGDLFHDRESLRVEDLNSLVSFLAETDEKYGIKVISFPGNHDLYLKNSWAINSLKPLARYITSYHEVTAMELGGVRFWVVPFIHYESEYIKEIAKVNKQHRKGDVLLTHIGVKSATLNMCFLLKSWSVVDFSDSPFDRIYSGHFHVHQQVGNNLWYPGSPMAFKFDEGDADHGFLVFDTETRQHKFIDLWEGEENPPPQYRTIDDSRLRNLRVGDIRGNIIRIALSRDYTHNQLSIIRRSLLQKYGAKDVRWMNLASKEDKEAVQAAKTTSAASAAELFARFLKADKEGAAGLRAEVLVKLNTEIVADGDRRYTEQFIE